MNFEFTEPEEAFRKGVRSHRFYRIYCWMTLTKNLRNEDSDL